MRGVPRWFAVLAVVAFGALLCAFVVRNAFAPAKWNLQLSEAQLPADGFSTTELKIHLTGQRMSDLRVEADDPHRASVESVIANGNDAIATIRAGLMSGQVVLRISAAHVPQREIALTTAPDLGDSIGDGTPDFLRLHDAADRAAFRRWFTLLAESQYYNPAKLPAEIGDCAALLRYSYREALRQHDAAWAKTAQLAVLSNPGDPRQYHYPYTPLGSALFRLRDGEFRADDLHDGAFAEFADAKALWLHNTFFVGRDIGRARPGDLLFFRQAGQHLPFHAIVFLGPSQLEGGDRQYVVYHTGPSGKSPGEIRRPSVAELINYPDARWRPVASNPTFLGVYRWNILRGDE